MSRHVRHDPEKETPTSVGVSDLIHVATLDVADEDTFLSWYHTEHIPEVLSRPGWQGARSYECINGEPRLLTVYDLVDEAAQREHRLSAAPFRTSSGELRGIRDYQGRTFRLIHAAGTSAQPPTVINVITVDVEPEHADAFSRWYNEVHFPEILACPGWIAGRRYECIDGAPRFLAIYDLQDEHLPFSTPEYRSAAGWDDNASHLLGYHGWRVYRLIYESYESSST